MSDLPGQLMLPGVARARRTDPSSSHGAAHRAERSGRADSQRQTVLEAVKRFPWSTSAEISARAGLDRYVVARRLPELREGGLIRRLEPEHCHEPCSIGGHKACRWGVIE